MQRMTYLVCVIVVLSLSPASASTRWCDDFLARVNGEDSGRVLTSEPNGWGTLYQYMEQEDKDAQLQRLVLGKAPHDSGPAALFQTWMKLCTTGKRANDSRVRRAMANFASAPSPPAKRRVQPDMSTEPSLGVTRDGKGFSVKSSRPLTDTELVAVTRQLGRKYDRDAIPGVIFEHESWRMKTKLYPDRSVRVIGGGGNTVYK